jgi:hypothetical protein
MNRAPECYDYLVGYYFEGPNNTRITIESITYNPDFTYLISNGQVGKSFQFKLSNGLTYYLKEISEILRIYGNLIKPN